MEKRKKSDESSEMPKIVMGGVVDLSKKKKTKKKRHSKVSTRLIKYREKSRNVARSILW